MKATRTLDNFILLLFTFVYLILITNGYQYYQHKIPNGALIPYPCGNSSRIWYGVGHKNSKGGGDRNAFGERFAKYGLKWNRCLCEEDTDGDGKSNGEELGDPDCEWTEGQQPQCTTGLSHPGICEPVDSALCQSRNKDLLNCSVDTDVQCDFVSTPEVESITLHFAASQVPEQETTYICQAFNMSQAGLMDEEYHLIAVQPQIDNVNVVHQILLYGCEDEKGVDALVKYGDPLQCVMQTDLCPHVIGAWTAGNEEICYDDNTGFPLGKNGYKTVIMQLQWNNLELRDDYTDGSGMTLFYTANKRMNDAGVVLVGAYALQIPPAFPSFDVTGGCTVACMSSMLEKDENIYLYQLLPRMHYLGQAFTMKQLRNGATINIINIPVYVFEDPDFITFDQPWEVRPGDELLVTCNYQSMSQNSFTYYGEAFSDEMCYAILWYYPRREKVQDCVMSKGYGYCMNNFFPEFPGYCNERNLSELITNHWTDVITSCDPNGLICKPGCEDALGEIKQDPCLTGNISDAIIRHLSGYTDGRLTLNYFGSCEFEPPNVQINNGKDQIRCNSETSSAYVLNKRMNGVTILVICLLTMVVRS